MPFRDLSGHRQLLPRLAAAAARDSLPPSLLFGGPEGVGKGTAALALAQLLNCLDRRDGSRAPASRRGRARWEGPDACGACAACRRIARGQHADVLKIEPGETGSIKIDRVREAIERSAYRPFEGRRRVVIIDDADALVPEAQNALLKTLEEPPSASVFILVTARPDVLLPTVRSRCQRLRFGRLTPDEIANLLRTAHRYPEADARAAASAADGSLARALAFGSSEFIEAREAAEGFLRAVAVDADPARRLGSAKALVPVSGRLASDRDGLGRRLHALASLLRDLEVLSTRADPRWLANGDRSAGLDGLRSAFAGGRTLRAFAAVDRALSALERHASPKVVADWLAVRL